MSKKSAEPWTPPGFVNVPTPQVVPRGRGAASTNPFGASLRTRMSKADEKLIREEVEAMKQHYAPSMTDSMFIRWSAVYMARALRKARTNEVIDVDT